MAIALMLALNFVVSWINCWSVGGIWRESRALGGAFVLVALLVAFALAGGFILTAVLIRRYSRRLSMPQQVA
ncbi:hypothetical protein [Paraburkholderia sp. C35]|uniref:hypothetical protein n=1 Tax=Paraburkholderia sp. C35 TaxID=2126993 RepID=UPI000D6924B0|nr:hypothetical protein [Paraburkholderia sp. C35]